MTGSVQISGLPNVDYYAPAFKVEIDGEGLSPETISDVLNLKVVMDMDNMTSFDMSIANMSIANWEDRDTRFKYSDDSTFDVGRQVHIKMGYADKLVSMVTGQITRMTPRFPESGASTLTVSGLDGMFKLRDRKAGKNEETKYVNKADWEIAKIIAARNNLKVKVSEIGEKHPEVVQKNQDDAQFLMERAKRIDFDCFVLTNPDTTSESTLYFVKPTDGRDSEKIKVYELEWGKNLINFNPTINLSRQVSKLTVRGWSQEKKQAIVYTATPDDIPGVDKKARTGPRVVEQTNQGKQEIVVDAPVSTEEEAKNLAVTLLTERAYEYIKASGQIIGLANLRPGDNLKLNGLGKRFNGDYYVKRVQHTIGSSGYKTQFDVRRTFEGDLK